MNDTLCFTFSNFSRIQREFNFEKQLKNKQQIKWGDQDPEVSRQDENIKAKNTNRDVTVLIQGRMCS